MFGGSGRAKKGSPNLGSRAKRADGEYCLDPTSWKNMFKNFDGYVPFHMALNSLIAQHDLTTEIELLNLSPNVNRNVGTTPPGISRFGAMNADSGSVNYGWSERANTKSEAERDVGEGNYLCYDNNWALLYYCLLYTSPSPRDS